MAKKALIAIGGNSLINPQVGVQIERQWDTVRDTCRHLVDMIEDGWDIVITHGNGPQVGFNLRRSELASHELYELPLDLIVAHTQGSIGYMLQQAMENELNSRGMTRPTVTLITQVLVDRNDAGFSNPTKPIGSFMSEAEAMKFREQGWSVVEDSGRGWRRVVASPQPLQIIERRAIRMLLEAGSTVIACGGGGIPVTQDVNGELRELSGAYAVIDKDRASSLLAIYLNVDLFVISTGVEKVALNYGAPDECLLDRMTVAEGRLFLSQGHFPAGSMRPKVEACLDYVQNRGRSAIITNPQNVSRALRGESGTWITP